MSQIIPRRNFGIGGLLDNNPELCNNPAQMAYEHWLVTTATIDSCEWNDPPSDNPSSLFVGYFTVVFSYAVDGKKYCGKFHSSHPWGKETEVGMLYNPQDPVESCVSDEDESQILPVLECVFALLGDL